jgi:DNA-binding CsgD family transcriptional regulator
MRRNFQLSPMKAPYLGGGRSVTVAFPRTSVTIIATSTVFEIVGREEELAELKAFVGKVHEGPAALVLEGEAGIGKSTLWLAAVAAARERGLLVLSSRPAEAERSLAHVTLGDLFEAVADELLPALAPARRRALEVVLLRDEASGDSVDQRALAVAVRDVLQLLSERKPILLAVDDVQWLDSSSSSTLAFALRRIEAGPVLVLLARRLVANADPSELEEGLGSERVRRLPVRPLSVGALHRLLHDRFGRPIGRQTLLRIHERSGGNPIFALELARALDEEVDPLEPLPVPETLDELVRARLAGLPAATRDALALASVLGTPSVALLERAGVAPEALAPAVDAHVVEREDGAIRFTHPLLSSVLYRELGEQRRSIHARIVDIVDDPIARARHRALSTDVPDADIAVVLDDAARLAAKRGASAAAAELAEHALRLTPRDAREQRHGRALAAARAHRAAGEWTRARTMANDLLTETETGPLHAETLILLAGFESRERAIALLEEALGEANASPTLRSMTHCWLSWATRFRDGFGVAFEHARTALALAEEVDDDALRVDALKLLTINGSMVGDSEARLYASRAHELASGLRDDGALKEATLALAAAHGNDHADFDSTRELLEHEYREWRERDEPFAADLLWYLAWIEFWSGRWDVAADYAARQGEIKAQYGLELTLGYDAPILWIALHRGELELARDEAERSLTRGRQQLGLEPPVTLAVAGLVELWSGDARAAVERLDKADAGAAALGWRDPHLRPWTGDYVEALLELDRVDDAVRVLDTWEADAARLEREWVLAHVTRCRGLVAAAQGRVGEAVSVLEDAVVRHERVGDGFGGARALLALGVVRRRERRKRDARDAIEEALAGFERLGAATWIENARAELGRIGGRTRAEGLTLAERRVAALVAEGRTNREVAAALFVGERTVETHLSHVYAKLAIRSRTELARVYRPGSEAAGQSSGELTIPN